jgi:hypothetical protein
MNYIKPEICACFFASSATQGRPKPSPMASDSAHQQKLTNTAYKADQ